MRLLFFLLRKPANRHYLFLVLHAAAILNGGELLLLTTPMHGWVAWQGYLATRERRRKDKLKHERKLARKKALLVTRNQLR